jgi:hypothetical protein
LRRTGADLLAQKDTRIADASRHLDGPNSLADQLISTFRTWQTSPTRCAPARTKGMHWPPGWTWQLPKCGRKKRLLTTAYLGTQHPDSKALHFLLEANEIEVKLTRARKRLKANDFLDVYDVYRLEPRQKLWEAHFHYTSANANPRRFAKGHLKFPNTMSRDERLQRAQAPAERYEIYR